MGKIGWTVNALILLGVLAAITFYRGNAQQQRWQNAPVAIHSMLPKQPRFAFHQIQGGQGTLDKPVRQLAIPADSPQAELIVEALKEIRITPLPGLDSTLRNVGDITLRNRIDEKHQRHIFHAIEILAWPSEEPLPEDAPPFFKLEVVNDHWAILSIAGKEILRGRLSQPLAQPLAALHDPTINQLAPSPDDPAADLP